VNGPVKTYEEWQGLTDDQRDYAIFQALNSLNRRLENLEKRPLADKIYAFLGGIVGGALAFLGFLGLKKGG